MTCHCRSKEEHAQRAVENERAAVQRSQQQRELDSAKLHEEAQKRIAELRARTPNPDEYTVEQIEQVGRHLVIKVRYPGCAACDFDRCKVMAYLDIPLRDVVFWKRIDPHFRAPSKAAGQQAREAPSPAARFPASAAGWTDAIEYARRKAGT